MHTGVIVGRLTKDPEVFQSQSGSVVKFTVASKRRFKKDVSDFFQLTAFGKTGDIIAKNLKQGDMAVFSYEPQNNNYKNKDGKTVYGEAKIVNDIEFLPRGTSQAQTQQQSQSQTQDDDEIPF